MMETDTKTDTNFDAPPVPRNHGPVISHYPANKTTDLSSSTLISDENRFRLKRKRRCHWPQFLSQRIFGFIEPCLLAYPGN
jgi:hypothetical protein